MAIVTPTKISLISDALVLLGEKPASSLTENRYGVTVGANLFEGIYENELCSNRWRFAMTKDALSQLVDTPLNEWQYAYQKPADMLLLIGVYPFGIKYRVYGDHIYTNASAVEADYMFKPEVSEIPAYFAQLMRYALARDMIKPLTESDQGVQIFEGKYVRQRDRSLFADSQQQPNESIKHSPFTQARSGGYVR